MASVGVQIFGLVMVEGLPGVGVVVAV